MAVVDAVVRLAQALGLRVVAEGVETEASARSSARSAATSSRGFLFARPMDAERLAIWASGEASTRELLERTQPIDKEGEEAPRLLQ